MGWQDDALVSPASDPSFTGYIPGTPRPQQPKTPVFVPKDATQMYDPNTGSYLPIPKAPGEQDDKDKLKEAIAGLGLDELLSNIDRARTNLRSPWASGTMGAIAELKPGGGTPRDNFLGNLTAVKGGVITEKLQSLKEASKTGASGFGSLSEKEGALLASSLAALTENMSPEEYERSFTAIARHALTLRAVRDGLDPTNPKVAKDIQEQAYNYATLAATKQAEQTDYTGGDGGGGINTVGASELSPAQQAADKDWLANNPNGTPEEYNDFLQKITGSPKDLAGSAARLAAVRESQKKTGAYTYNPGILDKTYRDQVKSRLNQLEGPNKQGTGRGASFVVGSADTASLGSADEAGAALDAVGQAFTGSGQANNIGDNYSIDRDANRLYMRGLQNDHGGYYAGGQFAGALAIPAGRVTSALDAAKTGAVMGGVYGFNSGEDAEGRALGAVGGALAGAGTAAAGSALAPYAARLLPKRLRPSQGMNPDLAAAADAESVDLIQPMVDPATRSKYGALESNRFSQPTIRAGADKTRNQIEGRVADLGQGGTALDTDVAGGIIQGAGARFITRSKGVSNALYDRARNLAGDTRFEPKQAIAQVDAELANLTPQANTNAGEISFLEGLKADLSTPGGKTVEELRQLRTSLRGRINEQNLGSTQAEARAIRAMDATQQDVAQNVPAAASAFKRADTYYRERQTHIDDIIEKVTGGKAGNGNFQVSGEQAFARLKSMASPGGDGRRLAALMRNLEPSERQDIAATIASQLGRDAVDEPFSAAKFLTQSRKLSPSARRTIFGPDGAQSISNLRTLSQALKDAGADINRSRSATVLERSAWRTAAHSFLASITGLGGYGIGGGAGAITGLAVGTGAMATNAAGKVLSARAMVNPRVSRWLAETASVTTQKQAQEQVRKLGVIITREPALALELQPIHEMLAQRVTQPLAAQPSEQNNE